MTNPMPSFIAFNGTRRIACGALADVALQVQAELAADARARVLVFDASTSEQVDFDHRGTPDQMLRRLALAHPAAAPKASGDTPKRAVPAGPGRPRLGVVAREVTLLPRHWEWLGSQPGGASVALRKLVDQARRANQGQDDVRQAQEASYRFMSAMAGEMAGFEEAARALFAGDRSRFEALLAAWPADLRAHLQQLAGAAFAAQPTAEPQHA